MDRRRTLLVDAFAADPLAGNVAGVVPDAAGLSADQMQAVARELGASETAFLLPADAEAETEADRRVRYFTPSQEVDLCGHATIASHAHLFADGVIDAGTHSLATNVGVLEIDLEDDGTVWMTQDDPDVEELDADYDRIADALGVPVDALRDAALPVARASTGLPFVVVPVAFLEPLGDADPDMAAIERLADDHGAVGVYAFTFDALEADSTLHARMFAPGAGVPEDPVTGTASGACGAYLRAVGAFETRSEGRDDGDDGSESEMIPEEAMADVDVDVNVDGVPDEMRFEQGHFVDRPGVVRVRVGDEVRVGGRAVTALDGTLVVPSDDADDIVVA